MRAITRWMFAGAVLLTACSEQRSPVTTAEESEVRPMAGMDARRLPMERLARRVALALRDPEFRTYVRRAIDGSPFVERKLPFARFVGAEGDRAGLAMAQAEGEAYAAVAADLQEAGHLEFYFPVAAHATAWRGGEEILVATEVNDHEAPVAFDVRGERIVLDPRTPPAIPVLAVVPQETDFEAAALRQAQVGAGCTSAEECDDGDLPPPPQGFPTPPPPGLYMSYFNAGQDFEGWLKGNPEFEIHILAPKLPGDTVSYRSVWCVGEGGGRNVYWNSDALTWRGQLLIYPQLQLSAFHAQYPGQDFSVLVLEDDDEACKILIDRDLVKNFISAVSSFARDYKAAKDSLTSTGKIIKAARSGYDFVSAAADLIQTNDEIVGTGIANSVSGLTHGEANWGVFGEGAKRNGWLGLLMQ